jgi:23S rRNA (guanine745-N1)-methyltransferase
MLDAVVAFLTCPVCGEEMAPASGALSCGNRHSFDIARQGYVNLLPGRARPHTADTPEMVEARAAFLGSGRYAPIAGAVAHAAAAALAGGPSGAPVEGCVVDAGAGPGYYLARVLDELPGRAGLALDISAPAARRASRAHERIGSVVCDTWKRLPVRSGAAALVIDVFSPRNADEFSRVLADGGALVVVTPTARHQREIVDVLGLVSVDERKDDRLEDALGALFELEEQTAVEFVMPLSHAEVSTLVAMGPSSRHVTAAQVSERLSALPEPLDVTASVRVGVYRVRRSALR